MDAIDPPADFPYRFAADGRLRHKDTQQPFAFQYRRGDVAGMQLQHEMLGRCIACTVYRVLEEQCGLRRVPLCHPARVYMSPKALEQSQPLLLLIQDKGTVRCGQWSWQRIWRAGLETGSQVPYVRRAQEESWQVLLADPNGGHSPECHVAVLWDKVVSQSATRHVMVVAHGYGGVALAELLARRPWQVQRQVCAVAFLDSCHSAWHQPLDASSRHWLKTHSRKWVLSPKPLNRPVGSLKADCLQLSAGTQCHEAAPALCMESVFRYFAKSIKAQSLMSHFGIMTRSRSQTVK